MTEQWKVVPGANGDFSVVTVPQPITYAPATLAQKTQTQGAASPPRAS